MNETTHRTAPAQIVEMVQPAVAAIVNMVAGKRVGDTLPQPLSVSSPELSETSVRSSATTARGSPVTSGAMGKRISLTGRFMENHVEWAVLAEAFRRDDLGAQRGDLISEVLVSHRRAHPCSGQGENSPATNRCEESVKYFKSREAGDRKLRSSSVARFAGLYSLPNVTQH